MAERDEEASTCDDDAEARRKRAERIHAQIESLKESPAASAPRTPRDFIADRMNTPARRKKK